MSTVKVIEKLGNATFDILMHEFKLKTTISKEKILADGIDTATITAQVYNYLDEINTTWTGDIIFTLDGSSQSVATTNGKASISFSSSVVGEYEIEANAFNLYSDSAKVVAS